MTECPFFYSTEKLGARSQDLGGQWPVRNRCRSLQSERRALVSEWDIRQQPGAYNCKGRSSWISETPPSHVEAELQIGTSWGLVTHGRLAPPSTTSTCCSPYLLLVLLGHDAELLGVAALRLAQLQEDVGRLRNEAAGFFVFVVARRDQLLALVGRACG